MDGSAFDHMFVLELSILEKMLRPVLVYAFLMISLRLAGKRELAQLNSMDLIVLLTLSNTVQNAIIGSDNTVSGGLIGAATLLTVNHFVVRFLFSHEKINEVVEGKPELMIENGKLCHDRLKKELVTEQELLTAAHKQGFASLAHVDQAILEPSGAISFVGKEPTPDETRHAELTRQIADLGRQIAELQAAVNQRG